MPRTVPNGPQAAFAAELRRLHRAARKPLYRALSQRSGLPPATISEYFNGKFVLAPSWDKIRALVEACVAESVRDGKGAVPAEVVARGSIEWWRRRHGELVDALDGAEPESASGSAYLWQVRRIAPERLIGRERELAELAEFCSGSRPYLYLRAPAWAGKSALVSWFVLHPPPGVKVVSFFITARHAGQSDRVAFTNVVPQQLSDLLHQPTPSFLTDATRDSYFLALLAEAAEACRRLMLVVDGLDEDQGVTAGPDAHSIAALLPEHLPDGVRIIVTGRPHPPIPADVPPRHPLRDPAVVRPLDASPYADVVRHDAERDLDRLLVGPPAEQDLLGLITAAGGGLSGADLTELTGHPPRTIRRHLLSVAGRAFTSRTGQWRPGSEVYLLCHEELQQAAADFIGDARLAGYRQRLHGWCDRYRALGWPVGTPEYLLRGYFQLLASTCDTERMVACATDSARHDRMLDMSGGDAAALAEITATQAVVDDLTVLVRLTVHRERLERRNANMPSELPALWASLGHLGRAEALIRSIGDPSRQMTALAHLVKVVAGEQERVAALLDWGQELARSVQGDGCADLVRAAADIGDFDRAEALAHTFTHAFERTGVLYRLAVALVKAGELDRAEQVVRSLDDDQSAWRGTEFVRSMAEAGAFDRAATWIDSLSDSGMRDDLTVVLVGVLAAAGHLERAIAKAQLITDPARRVRAFAVASGEVAANPDRLRELAEHGECAARLITDAGEHAWALVRLVPLMSLVCDFDRFAAFVDRAEIAVGALSDGDSRGRALNELADAVAHAREFDRAEALARRVPESHRLFALRELAKALAESGEIGRAEKIAHPIPDRWQQTQAMQGVMRAAMRAGCMDVAERVARAVTSRGDQVEALLELVRIGDPRRVKPLLDEAERVARSAAESPDPQRWPLAEVARSAAGLGWRDRAVALATVAGCHALADVAAAFAQRGDTETAADVAGRAEVAARSVTESRERTEMVSALIREVTRIGDLDRAHVLVQSMTARDWQTWATRDLAGAMAEAGDLDRAEALARGIEDPRQRTMALTSVARAVCGEASARAIALVDAAEKSAWSIADFDKRMWELACVVDVRVKAGDLTRAELLAHSIDDPCEQARAESHLRAAGGGDPNRMRVLADEVEAAARMETGKTRRSVSLRNLVLALARAGELDRAEAVACAQPDLLVHLVEWGQIADPDRRARLVRQAEALVLSGNAESFDVAKLVKMLADEGHVDRAEVVARTVEDPFALATALSVVAGAAARGGDVDRVRGLADDVAAAADSITESRVYTVATWQGHALASVIPALDNSGCLERAASLTERVLELARSNTDPDQQVNVLAHLADMQGQPEVARSVMAKALRLRLTAAMLPVLATIEPASLIAVADAISG